MVDSAISPREATTEANEHQRKYRIGRKDRPEYEAPFGELLERRLGQKLEEQCRQRHVDDEGIHPAERMDGLAGDPRHEEAQEDQPEKWQNETDDV